MAWNDWNKLRLQQMFGQLQQSPVQGMQGTGSIYEDPNEIQSRFPVNTPQQPIYNGMEDIDIPSIYARYPQQTKMQDMFAEAARNPPNRMNFQPSAMERISAGLQSFGGPGTYWGGIPVGYKANPNAEEIRSNILNRPYNEAALDYKMRIDPLRAAADDERLANINQRQLADAQINRQIQQGTLNDRETRSAEIARANLEREDVARKKLEQAQQALEIKDFIAKRPNMKPAIAADGTLYLYDSTDPTADPINTKINTGDLGDIQKSSLGITRDAARINAQGRVDLVNINARTQGAITVKGTVPGKNTSPVARAPGQGRSITSIEKALRIQQAIAADPSIDPYIVKNSQGMPTGGVKKGSWWNHDEDAYNRARQIIQDIPATTSGATSSQSSAAPSTSQSGTVEMKDKNGKVWRVKPENVEAFKRANGIQ